MSAKSLYIDAVSDKLNLGGRWITNWPPDAEVALGMVGDIDNGGFVQRGHLSDDDRAVPWDPDNEDLQPAGYDYATEGAVKVFAKIAGETSKTIPHVPKASAGIKIQFERENAVAARFDSVTQKRIKSEKALNKEVVKAWNDSGRMQLGDIIIVAVMDTAGGIAAVSASSSAEVQATVSADIGSGPVSLGSIKGKLGIAHHSGTDFTTTMPGGNVFAYRAVKLTREGRLWRVSVGLKDVKPGIAEGVEQFEVVEEEAVEQ